VRDAVGGGRYDCGHRKGECGACPRCGGCYSGFLQDHGCPDGGAPLPSRPRGSRGGLPDAERSRRLERFHADVAEGWSMARRSTRAGSNFILGQKLRRVVREALARFGEAP